MEKRTILESMGISMLHSLTGKKVLVTGGMGLVGAHLVERLVNEGARVVMTTRSFNPEGYFLQKKLSDKVVLALCDLNDYDRTFSVVTKYEIEYIFHLAAQPLVETAYYNPRGTFQDNIMGTVHILEAARQYPKVKAVVVASSDKAYGKNCDKARESNPMAGDHPYDVSKSCTDLIARTYAATYNLPVTVSRFGNIYGPGDLNLSRIIPGIIKAGLEGSVLEIRSDGKFVRDYVYVKDVVAGYLDLAGQIDTTRGEAFNFSTEYNFSVIGLITKVSQILGKPVQYEIKNTQKNEIPFQSLDATKAREKLGWSSAVTFEEGMRETIEWYAKYLNLPLPQEYGRT